VQKAAASIYAFENCVLDLGSGCLMREGNEVKIRPKSYQALRYLVENSGRLISKDELMGALWPDSFVTDDSLVKCLRDVRLALGDDDQHLIKTVPRRGYIFTALVSQTSTTLRSIRQEHIEGISVVIEEEDETAPKKETLNRPLPSEATGRLRFNRAFVLISLTITAFAIVLSYFWVSSRSTGTSRRLPRSIAVLPFKPLVADSRDESLEMGVADSLITRLSSLGKIKLTPLNAVRNYNGMDQDPLRAGKELNVEAVLEGSLQRIDDRIRVTARLMSVPDGAPLWAGKFDEKFADIFNVEDSITERVAGALSVNLTGEEKRSSTKRYTENVEAYQLYLKGRYFWELRTEDAMKKSVTYFDQAIQLDPNYALAYAGKAHSYTALRARGFVPPVDGAERMKEAVTKALELDDSLAEAHTVMGTFGITEFDWEGVEKEFKRAIELDPNYPTAHLWYGFFLEGMGRQDENVAERKRALEIEPLNFEINASLGSAFFHAGQYDKALEQEFKALELNPDFEMAHEYLGQIYLATGKQDQALAEFQKAWNKGSLGYAYAVSGRRDEAEKTLAQLIESSKKRYVSPLDMAMIYVGLDDKDQAFAWLEKACEQHATYLLFIKVDPRYSSLYSDSRFLGILRRVNFAS
jgi:TolB-like protein/DNA-binding winged helix-turn-helix (wHTH) protein/Tfp pilus assembly protein PilF